MAYNQNSVYGTTPITDNGLDILNYRPIPKIDSDIEYVIQSQYNYRPDLLASDLYDDSEYWWVFKGRNPTVIEDPIFDFVAGTIIRIPKLSTLKQVTG